MKRYGYWLLAGLLCLGAVAYAQEQKVEDYVQAVTTYLQEKTGKAPQPQEIVDTLNRIVVGILQKGDYRTGETVAKQTYHFAEQKLGSDHPDTLQSVNNLAALYQTQGRYREAEPLYRRALAASEKVLGPEHPFTLKVQLNYTVTLVNLKQPKRALQLLERMEPRLLELVPLQLHHTRQESVRRLFLTSQSNFQDAVLTLALSHPEPDYLDLAAKVMLRWKQIQGEEEAFLARLVRRRSEKDAEIRELAKQIADLRRDLSHLANLPEPNADLQRKKLNELEAKEIRLAQISREFNRIYKCAALMWTTCATIYRATAAHCWNCGCINRSTSKLANMTNRTGRRCCCGYGRNVTARSGTGGSNMESGAETAGNPCARRRRRPVQQPVRQAGRQAETLRSALHRAG